MGKSMKTDSNLKFWLARWCLVLTVAGSARASALLAQIQPCPSAQSASDDCRRNVTQIQEPMENSEKGQPWETDPLLPKDTVPEAYDIYLHPLLDEGVFNGKVSISVNLTRSKDHLLVHVQDLKITSTAVTADGDSSKSFEVKRAFEHVPNQFWVVQLSEALEPGSYSIHLKFKGNLTRKIVGFYRSIYTTPDNRTRYIATTKFEPTHARQAFPCFDEPAFKAKFNVKLVRPSKDYFALSNMNQIGEVENSPSEGYTTVEFATTPPMATYLACFIVCDFERLDVGRTDSGLPISVYARAGQIQSMKFAGDLAVRAMNYYTKYFDIDYPLPKLDLIAIPDFVSGAMENWGLITFRETSVLIREGVSSALNYEQVIGTVSHELAHMWFGDIVTMAWWDDLWLNEGFATFLTVNCEKEIFADWNVAEVDVLRDRQSALVDDATTSSHPIIQSVSHPDQITEMFDAISYKKGAAVLRMLEGMDPEKFQKAVSNYLRKFLYGNAKTDDLWESVQDEMKGIDVKRLMGTWTQQMGYPLVTAVKQGSNIVLKQERFLADIDTPFSSDTSPFGYKWDIPITYITSDSPGKVGNLVFNLNNESATITVDQEVEWFKLNVNQLGFYRVNYTAEGWKALEETLKDDVNSMSGVDRANLLDDAFRLAQAGYLPYDIPLSLMSYAKNSRENSLVPWIVLSSHLLSLSDKLYKTSFYPAFKKYAQSTVEPLVTEDTWQFSDNMTFQEKEVKNLWLFLACHLEIPSALNKARQMFNDWLSGGPRPNVEIRNTVYRFGITGDNDTAKWDKIWELYLNEQDPQEKGRYRLALASVKNPNIIAKLLELIKNEDYVRSQDYFTFLHLMADRSGPNVLIWNFIRDNWPYLVDRFTLNDRYLGRLIPGVTRKFATKEQLEEVKSFFKRYPEAGAGASGRKVSIEVIDNNIKWNNKHLPVIEAWLSQLHALN